MSQTFVGYTNWLTQAEATYSINLQGIETPTNLIETYPRKW